MYDYRTLAKIIFEIILHFFPLKHYGLFRLKWNTFKRQQLGVISPIPKLRIIQHEAVGLVSSQQNWKLKMAEFKTDERFELFLIEIS